MKARASSRDQGFTLFEVMIAVAILAITLGAILMVQSGSLRTSEKTKRMNAVFQLARNKMIETEFLLEGKLFTEINKEEAGAFKEPYQDFRWKRLIAERPFPSLLQLGDKELPEGASEALGKFSKLLSKYLTQSLREVTVTIEWDKGKGVQSYSLTQYWVDLGQPFPLSE